MRELTTTELDAVSGGAMPPKTTGSSGFQLNIGSFDGNALLNVQSQVGNGNGIGNSNIGVQSNNNNIHLSLGGSTLSRNPL
jgi:hypothetical protein